MVLNIRSDGTGPTALEQLVAQHRSGFCADFDLQAGADFADTAPAPAEACTDIGAEPNWAPPKQQRPARPIGAYLVVTIVAACCAGVPLLWHAAATHQVPAAKPPSLGVMA